MCWSSGNSTAWGATAPSDQYGARSHLPGYRSHGPGWAWGSARHHDSGGQTGLWDFCRAGGVRAGVIAERTRAGLAAARARGRKGGAPFKMTPAKLRLAMAAMGQPETQVSALCKELGITRQTLYRHVSPQGELRPDGRKLLGAAEGLRRGERRTVPWQDHRDSPALREAAPSVLMPLAVHPDVRPCSACIG